MSSASMEEEEEEVAEVVAVAEELERMFFPACFQT